VAMSVGADPLFPQILLFLALFNLLAGNGAFMFLNMIAPIRRGWLGLIPYSLTAFGYWVLMSVAAYKALWQLISRPFYWEKTQHGVSRHVASAAVPVPGVVP
jgi:glycosyltransferase XagB